MHKTAFNTTDGPLVIDDAGHTIGGGEWGTVQTTDPLVQAAVDADLLVVADIPDGDDVDPNARAAADRTAEVHDRSESLGALEPAELQKLAGKSGVESEGLTKAKLVSALERSDVDIPSKNAPKATSAKKEA